MRPMTNTTAGLAVTAHVGQVALAIGDLMHSVTLSWSDERQAWRMDVQDGTQHRTFWHCGKGWRYDWLGRAWWRPTLWPVLDEQHLAAEVVLVLAGLVSWPASTSDQHEGAQPGLVNELVVLSQ